MTQAAVTDAHRRRLLGARHLLTPSTRTDDVEAITASVVALHSTDPVSVYLSVLARMRNPDLNAVAEALYARRSLIRHHAMRRTLWVATPDVVSVIHRACTMKIADAERRKTEAFLATSGITDPGPWLADASEQVCRVLAEHGPISAREIGKRLPDVARPLAMAQGKTYAGTQGAHSRVVTGLGFEGVAVRTRPSGSWINGQYAWARMQDWAPDLYTSLLGDARLDTDGQVSANAGQERAKAGMGHAGQENVSRRQAQAELARLWLSRFGPGTERDLSWWAGWTLGDTRAALAACGAERVETQTGSAWAVPDDVDVQGAGKRGVTVTGESDDEPWVALLPGLDPSVMGWKERGFYLAPGGETAWDNYGNAGPTVWVDGQVVGAWGQTRSGEIRLRSFVDLPADRRRQIEDRAAQVAEWLGATRISWRFPGAINAELIAP
ncbi:MAG: winged helix DNA-binding domain-containing protein [Ornithinimicrobium sp.]